MRVLLRRILKKIFNMMGIDIVRFHRSELSRNLALDQELGFEFENQAAACISIIRHNTMLSKRRLVTLYQQVVYCEQNEIIGAYVECGVWKGGAVGLMALANLQNGKDRRHLHLLDSFEEICEPDTRVDGDRAINDVYKYTGRNGQVNGKLQPVKGIYDFLGGPGTLDENRHLLEDVIGYPAEYIHYHKGWFQETLPEINEKMGAIAILRLDGDWYASTKVCLEYLFGKVVHGGVVIIDDYGTYEGCRRAVDEFIKLNRIRAYLTPVDSDCRFFIKI